MPRFILIDSESGYVWGEATAETPAAACVAVDRELGAPARTYEERGRLSRPAEAHYAVYVAEAETPEITDGQDAAQIDIVESLDRAACVIYRDADA